MVRHRFKRRLPSMFGRNPRYKSPDPVERLRRMVLEEGSLTKAAHEIGIAPAYLSLLVRGRREPGDKVLKFLGVKKIVHRIVRYVEDDELKGEGDEIQR